MSPVVIEDIAAKADIRGFLIRPGDRCKNAQATRIDICRKALGRQLSGHFGDVFSVNRVFGCFTLDHKGLLECGFVLCRVDKIEFMHAPQYILLTQGGSLRINHRIERGGRFR